MQFHITAAADFVHYAPADGALAANPAAPVVIHVPGYNADGFSDAAFALRIAQLGWHCYTLEPPWSVAPDLQNPDPALLFDLFDRLEPAFLRLVAQLPEAAWRALTGVSMGGMFVSRELVRAGAPRFDAAALVLSSGDWSFLPRTAIEAIPDLRDAVDNDALRQIEAFIRAASPVARADQFPPTPLLLLNVEGDPRVPAANVRAFYDTLAAAYAGAGLAGRLEAQMLPGANHEFRRQMQRTVRDWLRARHADGATGQPTAE